MAHKHDHDPREHKLLQQPSSVNAKHPLIQLVPSFLWRTRMLGQVNKHRTNQFVEAFAVMFCNRSNLDLLQRFVCGKTFPQGLR